MIFDDLEGLGRVAIISLLAYVSLILALRLAGKRAIAKLNAFDFVVTVALGSTLATVLLSSNVAFLEGFLAFAMLALLQWAVSRLSTGWRAFRKLVKSQPRLLLENGRYLVQAMADDRTERAQHNARRAGNDHDPRIPRKCDGNHGGDTDA